MEILKIILNVCPWVICHNCLPWVLIISIQQNRCFPPTNFLPPLSHQIIAKSTQFIYQREVEAPVRLSRRSHSDVYFCSQVYLTLKPQSNLFIYPAVAKVHNNTPREPRDAVAGGVWRLRPKKGSDNNVPELKWAEAMRRSKLIVFPNLSAAICEY